MLRLPISAILVFVSLILFIVTISDMEETELIPSVILSLLYLNISVKLYANLINGEGVSSMSRNIITVLLIILVGVFGNFTDHINHSVMYRNSEHMYHAIIGTVSIWLALFVIRNKSKDYVEQVITSAFQNKNRILNGDKRISKDDGISEAEGEIISEMVQESMKNLSPDALDIIEKYSTKKYGNN